MSGEILLAALAIGGASFILGFYLGLRWSPWRKGSMDVVIRDDDDDDDDDEWAPRSRSSEPKQHSGIHTAHVVEVEVPDRDIARVIVQGLGQMRKIPPGYIATVGRTDTGWLIRAWDDGYNLKKKMLKDAKETL